MDSSNAIFHGLLKVIITNSNAHAYVTRRLIEKRQKFATVYSVIYCIRMGITTFKFVIWGGKSAVLRSQITFYGSANALP